MITDRELLSLAAKAAGIYLVWNGEFPVEVVERWSGDPESQPDYDHQPWNPLTDDGDALRLAVSIPALDLHWVVAKAWQTFSIEEARRAHVRRSIVSAAAELGRMLP